MNNPKGRPTLTCGKILLHQVPNKLSRKDPPLTLATVTVNPTSVNSPCVLFNYSQNVTFVADGEDPLILVVYRLVKLSKTTLKARVLDEWSFKVAEIIPTDVPSVKTIEPIVFNFCDWNELTGPVQYIFQIAEIVTNNIRFSISEQEISAIVASGSDQD
ncbi:DUF4489 domain-containing protein [Alkalihalobacillus macyae]|uniref:DUF4489 domain-containing protein n=1 Tax=Guptibacillus hwajinpoensis TaxID=208199 RepID=UPI00273B69DC|nr:DUF4489 domain-containing protein [Alkalihalobacillus macyae]MDP4549590.1 DUF4489 domain-containing protein [Alkalihalobacillus macyae]